MSKQKEIEILTLARGLLAKGSVKYACVAISLAVECLGYGQYLCPFSWSLRFEVCEFLDGENAVAAWLDTAYGSEINLVFRLAIIDTLIARRA